MPKQRLNGKSCRIRTWKLTKVPERYRKTLYTFCNHAWSVFRSLYIGAWFPEDSSKSWRRYWKKLAKKSICMVYFLNGVPAGISINWGAKIGCYVKPSFRRMGIGTELVCRLAKKMKRMGVKKIVSVPFTRRGVALYEKANEESTVEITIHAEE